MSYRIVYDKPAVMFLRKQSSENREWIVRAIHKLPFEGDIKPMRGHEGEYRLRVGVYRIIYSVDHGILIVKIMNIGNRGDVYRYFLSFPPSEPAWDVPVSAIHHSNTLRRSQAKDAAASSQHTSGQTTARFYHQGWIGH